MFKILVVEDDKNLRKLIVTCLEKSNYTVFESKNGEEALEIMDKEYVELIVTDIMMPEMDGYEMIQLLREAKYETPILIITAKEDIEDKRQGFTLGADDYMVKPFLPKELLFRVNAILRRSYKAENPLVKLAASEIDFDRAEVIRGGEHLSLTAKEHDILAALYRNAGRIVTIDALCEAAWGDNPFGYENSLMAHIRRIREKIEASPSHPASLITIKGLGYKLMVEGK